MATKTITWPDGSIATLTYNGHGSGTITVQSEPNNHYEIRSAQIKVRTTDGSDIERTVTIVQAAKVRIDISTAIVTAPTQTYSGSALIPTPTVTLNGETVPSSGYDVAYSNNTNAGTATITITGKGDYTGTAIGTFTINKANPTYTAPTARTGLTYLGSSQYLVTAGSTSHGTIQYSSNGTTWSTTRPSSTNAGSYTTYWRLVGDSNHNDVVSTSLSTTIAKASRTLSFTDSYVVLDTSSNVTKTATPSAGSGDGTITYSISSTTYATINSSSGKVTSKTSDGSAIVTATIAEGTNYLSASASYNLYVFATTHNYDYNGSYRSVTLPPGTYQFQCWGAKGGSNAADSSYGITAKEGGKGGYSEGVITLSQKTIVRVYVGGQGSSSDGGFNGGGSTTGTSTYDSDNELGVSKMGGGGGATDIRLSDGALLSRMIVAGGGSGGAMVYKRTTSQQTITDIIRSSYSLIYNGYYASDGTSSSLWANADMQTGNAWGDFGFKATRSGYITSVTIQAVTSYSSNLVHIYSEGGSSPLRSANVVGTISVGTGTYQLQEPLYVQAGEIICFKGAGFKYKTSGGDCNTYTGGTYDGAQRIYSFNFNYSDVKKCYVENYTGLVAGQTYNLSGLSGYYYVKFTKSANIWATSQEITYSSPSSFTVPSGYSYFHVFTETGTSGTLTISHSESVTSESNDSQVGFVGGGTNGGGYSSSYQGKQNGAGSGGSFGQGANQTATNYRYCSGAGGGGWYGGGGGQHSDSTMATCKFSGGGSGFVNTTASAGNRPSGYTGLQLDSGETKAGNTSFPAPGGGNETGHAGNGYARITRLS